MSDEERRIRENNEDFEGDVPAAKEASLLNLRTLLISVAGLIGMVIFIQLAAGAILIYFRSTEPPSLPGQPTLSATQPPVGPGLQIAPAEDLLRVRATEQARLNGYGWIDREAEVVHIPIEQAMEILAERGLPVAEDEVVRPDRIDARESGFPHPTELPTGPPGPIGTPLLEIKVPVDLLESLTPEPDGTETTTPEASPGPAELSGTPAAFSQLVPISHGSEDENGQDAILDAVRYDQKLNSPLPLEISLVDETGSTVHIGDYFGDKPVILVFAYYECPMLCTLVLNELTRAMRSIDLDIGSQFDVITISIDHRETYELAYAKKLAYLSVYNRPGAERGWHFLTGGEKAIQDLTEAVGFRYEYDEELDQYAHPAGVLVLTPEGRVARYFSGLDLPAKDLRLGLVEASAGKIGTAIDKFFLLCYAYNPVFGRYTLLIGNVIKIAGLLTVTLLGSMVSMFVWKERRKSSRYSPN